MAEPTELCDVRRRGAGTGCDAAAPIPFVLPLVGVFGLCVVVLICCADDGTPGDVFVITDFCVSAVGDSMKFEKLGRL